MINMSEFDNKYLCPKCEHIGELSNEQLICEICDFEHCFVAKHINEGNRKWWIKNEESSGEWRRQPILKSQFRKQTIDDKILSKQFEKGVKKVFEFLNKNRKNMDSIFPEWTRDYNRTYGKRNRGWKDKRSPQRKKQSTAMGILYEGAFNQACKEINEFESILIPIEITEKGEEIDFEPDAWFLYNGQKIPVEFKTKESGSMAINKFSKGLKQSRRYGKYSRNLGLNPNCYSGIIFCSPEDRIFTFAIINEKIDNLI